MEEINYRKILADNVRAFRNHEGSSQLDFALNVGVSTDTINNIENQKTNVTLFMVEILAEYMGISTANIFTENYVSKHVLSKGAWDI